jgi:hypothetical protein
MKQARFRPRVEEFEGRAAPSGLPGGPPHTAPVILVRGHPVHLAGMLAGSYTSPGLAVDAGVSDTLTGSGPVGPLGQASVTGTVQGVGFIRSGRAGGTLTLAGPRGAVTLRLRGPVQPAFSPLPPSFAFTVTGGTGAYKGATGHGTATLSLTPAPGQPGHVGGPLQGTFTLTLA